MGATHTPRVAEAAPSTGIQTAPNLVGFDPKQVVPEQPIYFQRNDVLNFLAIVNTANTTIQINYRFLMPNGEIKEGQFNTPPIFSSLTFNIPLYEGWLLSFAAISNTGFTQGSWSFLQAFIGRPNLGTATPIRQGMIWEGFIRQGVSRGWPGTPAKESDDGAGEIRFITGTTPGAGADISETVPTNRRWTLLSLFAQLTASATVANRFPRARLDNGASAFYFMGSSNAQVASTLISYSFAPGIQFFNDTNGDVLIPLPNAVQLKMTFRFQTSTANLQAGDQWSAPFYEVIEWPVWDP